MPDITMCRDTDCPKRKQCYRYMAKPNEYWQSYFVNTPREGKGCRYFDPVERGPDSIEISCTFERTL